MGRKFVPTIHIRRKIDSETLHLPELRPLLGRIVDITIVDDSQCHAATAEDWEAFFCEHGTDFVDPSLYAEYREFDRKRNLPD